MFLLLAILVCGRVWIANQLSGMSKLDTWSGDFVMIYLPTDDRSISRRLEIESQRCVLCADGMESDLHCCRDLSFSKQVLNLLLY